MVSDGRPIEVVLGVKIKEFFVSFLQHLLVEPTPFTYVRSCLLARTSWQPGQESLFVNYGAVPGAMQVLEVPNGEYHVASVETGSW